MIYNKKNIKEQIEKILLNDFGSFDEYTVEKLFNLINVVDCFNKEDMIMSYLNGASESTVNDLDLTIELGAKVDAENFLKKYIKK